MTASSAAFSALVGSRICHDLISPIGAINNGLELLGMSGDLDGPEMTLIGESVGNASARIRFFRIAFGAAGDQLVGAAEVSSILRDLYDKSRLDITWAPTEPQPRAAVRLAFLGLLCLETAMPYGGRAQISAQDMEWTLEGSADKISKHADLWKHLTGEPDPHLLQPSQVQFGLLPLLARADGRRVKVMSDDRKLTLRF
ncbi:histidine phosphotransferase family protein [Sulfitobacter aestuariivivens]